MAGPSKKAKSDIALTPKRKRTFIETWKTQFPWVRCVDDIMFCEVCREYPSIADHSSKLYEGVTGSKRIETLQSHESSKYHLLCIQRKEVTEKGTGPMFVALKKQAENMDDQLKPMFNTAFYVAKQKLPFRSFEGLIELQEKNGIKMPTQYRNDKGCKAFVQAIAEVEKDRVSEDLKASRFFALMGDGSTDISVTEQENVYVRYVKDGLPATEFIDIMAVKSADANGVLAALLEALHHVDLTDGDIKKKIIGCTFDGASVNQGAKGGVIVKLRELLGHVLISIWCAPHKLELSLLDATKATDFIDIVEKGVDPIYRFYYGSGKRRREVNAISAVIDEDPVYFSAPCGTRWMASRLRAYKAVIKNYNSVILHMEEASNRKTDEGAKCVGYLKVLKSAKFVDGLHFMVDVLEVLANVSLAFQSNDLFIYDVDVKLCEARIKLEGLKHNRGDVYTAYMATCKDGKFDSKNNGHITSLKGTGIPETVKNSFLENCVKFLEKRFSFLKDTPFSDFHVLDPRNIPRSDAQLATYGDVQVMNMVTHFESVLSEEEVTNIPRQWPALKARLKYRQRQPAKEVISDLLTENHPDVKDVLVLVYMMVTLSPSSAAVERGFSLMNLIKTSRKSQMTNETLGSLMRVSHITTTVAGFDPEPAIQKWKTSAKTKSSV
nr:zinc finger protein 862-like isoform X2 [Pseudochaenichthys georgianus]